MLKPRRFVALIPASVLLAAGGPCGGDTDNPVVERCATSHTILVERGAKSAAIPNLCVTTVNTTEWDRSRWDVTFDIPPPLAPAAEWPAPDRPVYAVDAPMEATVGDVMGALVVRLKGSNCTSPLGTVADCVANIALTIRVVEPGTVPAFTVRIAATRGGAVVADDGRVPVGGQIALSAIAEGDGAAEATFTWRAVNLVGGAVDPDVDGKSTRDVVTSPFQARERVYEVTASAKGATAKAMVVLSGLGGLGLGAFRVPITGPLMQVPSYPGTSWVIRYHAALLDGYDVNGNETRWVGGVESGYARLDYLPDSASWSREAQDGFLRDPVQQAQAGWSTLGPNPERRLGCSADERGVLRVTTQADCIARSSDYPTYFMPAEAAGRLGIFRAVFWGATLFGTDSIPVAFSYTFVRRY